MTDMLHSSMTAQHNIVQTHSQSNSRSGQQHSALANKYSSVSELIINFKIRKSRLKIKSNSYVSNQIEKLAY